MVQGMEQDPTMSSHWEQMLDAAIVLLYVVPAWVAGRGGWVAWRSPWALARAVAAEEAPSNNNETCSSPSKIQGTSKLKSVNDNMDHKMMLKWTFVLFVSFTSLQLQTTEWSHYTQLSPIHNTNFQILQPWFSTHYCEVHHVNTKKSVW